MLYVLLGMIDLKITVLYSHSLQQPFRLLRHIRMAKHVGIATCFR